LWARGEDKCGYQFFPSRALARRIHQIYEGIDPVTERRRNGQADAFLGRIAQSCV
jgi:hypothetical protein